jgi:hypothetical protein
MRDYAGSRLPNPWAVPVVTVPVAAGLLGMSRTAAYRAVDSGELPSIRLDGALRVPVARLYALLGLPVPPRPSSPVIDR